MYIMYIVAPVYWQVWNTITGTWPTAGVHAAHDCHSILYIFRQQVLCLWRQVCELLIVNHCHNYHHQLIYEQKHSNEETCNKWTTKMLFLGTEQQMPVIAVPFKLGMLIFENFISRYENFKSRDSSSTRKLTQHSDVDNALNAWMLWHSRHSRHHAAWLGGGPWEVKRQGKLRWRSQITKRCRLSHSSFQTRPQTAVVPCPTMNSPRVTGWALCTV